MVYYNHSKENGGDKVEDKIKELTKLIAQLSKLMLKVLELLSYITLAEMAIKTMLQVWKSL